MIKFFRKNKIKLLTKTYLLKALKVTFFSLVFLLFLFLFSECISGFKLTQKDPCFALLYNPNIYNRKTDKLSFFDIIKREKYIANYLYFNKSLSNYFDDREFRSPSTGKYYKDKNIILAGSSFVWGYKLEQKDTFCVILTKFFPEYKVYNISVSGASPRETLYILRNYQKYQKKNILPTTKEYNVKHFIFTVVYDEKNVLFFNHRYRIPCPLYKIKKLNNGEKTLEYYESANPIYRTFTYGYFLQNFKPHQIFDKYLKNLFTLYMQEIKKEVNKVYPNSTFVLFIYNYPFDNNSREFDLQAIEKLGIKIIELNKISEIDFSKEKYKNLHHPNGKAWEEIVPLLGKELNL